MDGRMLVPMKKKMTPIVKNFLTREYFFVFFLPPIKNKEPLNI
jgi:hypothetical protein